MVLANNPEDSVRQQCSERRGSNDPAVSASCGNCGHLLKAVLCRTVSKEIHMAWKQFGARQLVVDVGKAKMATGETTALIKRMLARLGMNVDDIHSRQQMNVDDIQILSDKGDFQCTL